MILMGSPRERLVLLRTRIEGTPGNESAQRKTQIEVDLECAIEINDALVGLTTAANDMSNRLVLTLTNLTGAIEKSTAQAVVSSEEATSVAKESANLSRKLNRLTLWIIIAAIASAASAIVQAVVAILALWK